MTENKNEAATPKPEVSSYFNGNELAQNVWESKYALRNKGVQLEATPDDMHKRMAEQFSLTERMWRSSKTIAEDKIFAMLKDFSKVIPQGSVMASLGNKYQIASLSNCVVLPKIHDSYGGILYTDQQLVQTMKRRCGDGIDISTLRPSESLVSNAAQTSTGAVSFMHRFSNSTREVAQDGRRGALMITMDVRHPEAEQFALIKQDLTKVTGANISLKITDLFMRAADMEAEFTQHFPVDVDPSEAKVVKKIDAKKLWNTIVKCAHATAEPGIIFWDRQHRYSPSSLYKAFENISTNPCSEIAMGNDSCRLIALNMFGAVLNGFTRNASFDFEEWYWMCYNGMRLMDDLVTLETWAIDEILRKIGGDEEPFFIREVEMNTWRQLRESAFNGRRTGLGFTALADTIAALGMTYGSRESIIFAESVAKVKLAAELDSTIDMADERGAFPAFDRDLEAKLAEEPDTFFYMLKNEFPQQWTRMQDVGRRNISWSTVAPTGSLSLLAQLEKGRFGTTSGIEPLFSVYHIRRKKINANDDQTRVDFVDDLGDKWIEFPVFHEGFKMWYTKNADGDEYGNTIPLDSLSKKEIDDLIKISPYAGAIASEMGWKDRIAMQSVIQKYTTHSISSTINLPNDVSVEEVGNIYFEAWKKGLKGITVYRDGCRSGVLITEDKKGKRVYTDARKRPESLKCEVFTTTSKGIRYNVFVGLLEGHPYEVFATPHFVNTDSGTIVKMGKGIYDFIDVGSLSPHDKDTTTLYENFLSELTDEETAITRLISTSLRHGADIKYIVQQLGKIEGNIVSFAKAIARTLSKYLPKKEELRELCNECGGKMIREEGCTRCESCGSNKCS